MLQKEGIIEGRDDYRDIIGRDDAGRDDAEGHYKGE